MRNPGMGRFVELHDPCALPTTCAEQVGYSVKDLRVAGFTPLELHNVCFHAHELTAAGFAAHDLREGGYHTMEELKEVSRARDDRTAPRVPSGPPVSARRPYSLPRAARERIPRVP